MASLIAIASASSQTILSSLFNVRPLISSRFTSLHNNNNNNNNIKTQSFITKALSTSALPNEYLCTDQLETKKDLKQAISNQTDVALRLSKPLLLTQGKNKNMVYSPLSIHTVLSVIAAGSKGSTLDQLLSFLNSNSTDQLNSLASDFIPFVFADGSSNGGPCLSFANGLWVEMKTPLKPAFKQVVNTAYKAALNQVDFMTKFEQVRLEVNSWAEKETKGLIKDVLPPGSVHSLTRVIFANALYFKGAWVDEFTTLRNKSDFHLPDGSSIMEVPFMTRSGREFATSFDGFKVLEIPYKQGKDEQRRFSMCLFLPDAKDGLPDLAEKLCSESGFIDRHLPCEKVRMGEFRIPKFKISGAFEASEVLMGLGLELPFSIYGAEVTEMVEKAVGDELYYVSSIHHKSFIDFNEQGTEAAAVTTFCVSGGRWLRPLDEKKIDFVADHPFMFLIREQMTGTVLFIGHVLNPLQG